MIQYLYIDHNVMWLQNDHHNKSNICHYTQSQSFFLIMRTFKIYSISSIQICNIILLTIVIMLTLHPHDLFTLFFLNMYILLKYSWLTMFQVRSRVIKLYIYSYTVFRLLSIIGHYKILAVVLYAIQ